MKILAKIIAILGNMMVFGIVLTVGMVRMDTLLAIVALWLTGYTTCWLIQNNKIERLEDNRNRAAKDNRVLREALRKERGEI